MTAVSDKWLSQRQPSTGPQGAPGSGSGLLRYEDNSGLVDQLVLDGTFATIQAAGADLIVSIANPMPDRQYWTQLLNANLQPGALSSVIELRAQWRVDGGAWLDDPDVVSYTLIGEAETNDQVIAPVKTQRKLGSAIPVGAGVALLEARFQARVTSGGVTVVGASTGLVELFELTV